MKYIQLSIIILWGIASAAALVGQNAVKTSDLTLSKVAGYQLFSEKKCNVCHTLGSGAEGELTSVASMREPAWFEAHVIENSKIVLENARGARRQKRVLNKEIWALKAFLFKSGADKSRIQSLPENISSGAYLSYQNKCDGCHKIAGEGKEVGPDLTNIADRNADRIWLMNNLKNPQQFSAESVMTAFEGKVSDANLNMIVDYLLTLRK